MITETEVKWWAIDRGVSHVIMTDMGTFAMTLCGMFGNFGHRAVSSNGRICRECRDEMRVARPATGEVSNA